MLSRPIAQLKISNVLRNSVVSSKCLDALHSKVHYNRGNTNLARKRVIVYKQKYNFLNSYCNSRFFSTQTETADEVSSSLDITDLDKYEIWTTDSSYGLLKVFDPIKYFMLDNWIYISDDLGLGFGVGILLTSLLIRCAFIPFAYYAQKNGLKFRLIRDDIFEANERINQLKDNQSAQMAELMKIKELKKKVGIKNYFLYFSLFQLPFHISCFLLCNEISLNAHLYQTVQIDGFLWFSDLSFPDEYSVLPVLATFISFINIMSTSSLSISEITRSLRKYILVMPILALPIFIGLPASFNIYWLSSSLLHCIVLNLFRLKRFRQFAGIPEYYPGTKLEKKLLAEPNSNPAQPQDEFIIGLTGDIKQNDQFTHKETTNNGSTLRKLSS